MLSWNLAYTAVSNAADFFRQEGHPGDSGDTIASKHYKNTNADCCFHTTKCSREVPACRAAGTSHGGRSTDESTLAHLLRAVSLVVLTSVMLLLEIKVLVRS